MQTLTRKFRACCGMCGNIQLAVPVNYFMNNPLTVPPSNRVRCNLIGPPRADLLEIPGVGCVTGQAGPPAKPEHLNQRNLIRPSIHPFIPPSILHHAARLRSAPSPPRPQLHRLLRGAGGGGCSPPGTVLCKQPEWVPLPSPVICIQTLLLFLLYSQWFEYLLDGHHYISFIPGLLAEPPLKPLFRLSNVICIVSDFRIATRVLFR